jgi:hypothetical protein
MLNGVLQHNPIGNMEGALLRLAGALLASCLDAATGNIIHSSFTLAQQSHL